MPAVEPSLADAKPAEPTEAVEVPWTCGWIMRTAANEYKGVSMCAALQPTQVHSGSHPVVPLRGIS